MNHSYSVLYNLQPMYQDTCYVESLTSYISRLAEAHCLTSGILISKICTPHLNKKYLLQIAKKGGDGFYNSTNGINGIGSMARNFSEMMNSLTGRKDLSSLTFLKCSKILPTRGLMKQKKEWCPECYTDSLINNYPIYDQLIWFLQEVKCCTKHRVSLMDTCPSCNMRMKVFSRSSRPGFCQHCSSWLGSTGTKYTELHFRNYLITKTIQEMLEIKTTNININFDRDVISKSINFYVYNYFNNESGLMARYLNVSKSTFWGWTKGVNLPPLSQLVNISLKLGITLPEFFLKESVKILDSGTKNVKQIKQKRLKHDHLIIKSVLKSALCERSMGRSIKSIAETIGCDRRLLYLLYPEEVEILSLKYSNFVSNKTALRRSEVQKQIITAARKLISLNVIPSRKKIEDFMGKPGLFREYELEQFLNEVLKELL